MRWFLGSIAAASAVAALLPASASALTCAVPTDYNPVRDAKVAVEGVLLSGPRTHGALVSPARFAVSRYLKGSGRRTVLVRTRQRQLVRGGLTDAYADFFGFTSPPPAGRPYRLFAERSARRGRPLTTIGRDCGPEAEIEKSRVLAAVAGTQVRGGSRLLPWRAQLFRGRGLARGVRCLRFGRRPGSDIADDFGECTRGSRGTLLGVEQRGEGRRRSTGVAVASPRLRSVTVERGGSRRSVRARRGIALIVVRGRYAREDLRITVSYRGGVERVFGGSAHRAFSPGGLGYRADFQRLYARSSSSRRCVAVEQVPRGPPSWIDAPPPSGACGDVRRSGLFFTVIRAEEHPAKRPVVRTLVAGAIGPAVRSVRVQRGGEAVPVVTSARGRAFLANAAGGTRSRDLVVEVAFRDGSVRRFAGRRPLGVVRAPR